MAVEIQEAVKARYGSVATSGLSSDRAGVKAVAEARLTSTSRRIGDDG